MWRLLLTCKTPFLIKTFHHHIWYSGYPDFDCKLLFGEKHFNLSEKNRRAYAAIEALKLPRGVIAYIIRLLGCSKKTLYRGIHDLENPNPDLKKESELKALGEKHQ